MGLVVHESSAKPISSEIIDAFREIPVSDIGHIQQFGFMDTGIRPTWRNVRMVGPAFTVRIPSMNSGVSREVVKRAKPGDVLVIDRGGDTEISCWGGVVALLAKVKGIEGLVADGAVNDVLEFEALEWPVFSRTVSALLGRPLGLEAEINTTVSCGGVAVSPGDLICADDDGVLVIRPWEVEELLRACQERFGHVPDIRQWIRDGKDLREYPNARQFFSEES